MFCQAEDVLDKMRDEGEFASLVMDAFEQVCLRARLTPDFSPSLMHDTWESFHWDIKRLEDNMPKGSKPDHFKICGFAAYWLRRNSPVIDLKKDGDETNLSGGEKKWRELFAKYNRALLAFAFGYRICYFIEQRKRGGGLPPQEADWGYIESICYVMKYKNLSPHAMGMIYRSFFFGNGGGVYPA